MKLGNQLTLQRCPHCQVAQPQLVLLAQAVGTQDHAGANPRIWATYRCTRCGGVLLAVAPNVIQNPDVEEIWPAPREVADVVPSRAKDFLTQAIASIHAPAGAVMLAASSIDAMLKEKGYKEGTLNSRIDEAAKSHLITDGMATWAHEIRLDANDQRHADEAAPLPSEADAMKAIEFASALAQFLFILPARVERGRRT